jgi:hypothetical protein
LKDNSETTGRGGKSDDSGWWEGAQCYHPGHATGDRDPNSKSTGVRLLLHPIILASIITDFLTFFKSPSLATHLPGLLCVSVHLEQWLTPKWISTTDTTAVLTTSTMELLAAVGQSSTDVPCFGRARSSFAAPQRL